MSIERCPRCMAPLQDTEPGVILTSLPPQKRVHCAVCAYVGFSHLRPMDTQANKSATQDTAGMDPKGKECNAGMQAMCAGESLPPAPPHPLDYAIAELRSKLSVLEQNHAVAINMEDYVGAALFNEKRKSVSRAEALLRSIRCWS